MKIILTGSVGNISKPLAKDLIQRGHQVAIISSDPQKARAIEDLGARALIGDVNDVFFLTQAFNGVQAVYCMIPPNFTHPDQLTYYRSLGNNYASAIQRSGVKRVVHLSSYGAHLHSGTGFITGSYQNEQTLNAIDNIQLTHIRATFFYYNLLAFIGIIKAAGFIGAVYGGHDKIAMVSPTDIAEAVAQELEIEDNCKQIRYVTSDERSCNQVAEVLGQAIGIPTLKWQTLPADHVLKTLLERGISENAAKNLVELGEALHNGKLLEDYELHKPPFGKVKLEDYAREFAEAFARA